MSFLKSTRTPNSPKKEVTVSTTQAAMQCRRPPQQVALTRNRPVAMRRCDLRTGVFVMGWARYRESAHANGDVVTLIDNGI